MFKFLCMVTFIYDYMLCICDIFLSLKNNAKIILYRTSLVVQWLRFCASSDSTLAGVPVWSLVGELNPTCHVQCNQIAFTWKGQQRTFQVLPQGYLHFPTTCHGPITLDPSLLFFLMSIKWAHYINDVMLTHVKTYICCRTPWKFCWNIFKTEASSKAAKNSMPRHYHNLLRSCLLC